MQGDEHGSPIYRQLYRRSQAVMCHLCKSEIPNHSENCRVWSDISRFRRVYESFTPERRQSDLGLGLSYYIGLYPALARES